MHVLFEGFQIDLFFALRAEQKGEARSIEVVLGGDDLHARESEFGGAGAAVDHGFGLFGLPGLEQQQVARRCPPLHGSPAALRFFRRVLDNLDDLSEVLAA